MRITLSLGGRKGIILCYIIYQITPKAWITSIPKELHIIKTKFSISSIRRNIHSDAWWYTPTAMIYTTASWWYTNPSDWIEKSTCDRKCYFLGSPCWARTKRVSKISKTTWINPVAAVGRQQRIFSWCPVHLMPQAAPRIRGQACGFSRKLTVKYRSSLFQTQHGKPTEKPEANASGFSGGLVG